MDFGGHENEEQQGSWCKSSDESWSTGGPVPLPTANSRLLCYFPKHCLCALSQFGMWNISHGYMWNIPLGMPGQLKWPKKTLWFTTTTRCPAATSKFSLSSPKNNNLILPLCFTLAWKTFFFYWQVLFQCSTYWILCVLNPAPPIYFRILHLCHKTAAMRNKSLPFWSTPARAAALPMHARSIFKCHGVQFTSVHVHHIAPNRKSNAYSTW